MTTITKRLEIDAGHRLLKHEGKCRHVHGHRYAFEITCTAPALDSVGRVIDFSQIKEKVGGWLDKFWDHAFIAQVGDPIIPFLNENGMRHDITEHPPTAENLAQLVFEKARQLLTEIKVVHVTCYETPTSRAGYSEKP